MQYHPDAVHTKIQNPGRSIGKILLLWLLSALLLLSTGCAAVAADAQLPEAKEGENVFDAVSLPVISIVTETGEDVTTKETYIYSTFTVSLDGKETLSFSDVRIRGRGNQSWLVPKKSYRLKFPEKTSLLFDDQQKNRDWILTANHCDKSLLRNYIAYSLGSALEGIEWSPAVELVEVYLNGEYRGVYLLTERVEVSSHRISIDDTGLNDDIGFLVELDGYASGEPDVDYITVDDYMYTIRSNIRTPGQLAYLKDYLTRCREAVRAGDRAAIEALIDLDSFVDMYLLQEYMRNVDSGWSSFYLYIKENGGKLYFGAPWDFDLSASNCEETGTEGLLVGNPEYSVWPTGNTWYQLLSDQVWFRQLVSERWSIASETILRTVNECCDYAWERMLLLQKNFDLWDIFGLRINREPEIILTLDSYEKQLAYLQDWLQARWEHLGEYFASAEFLEPPQTKEQKTEQAGTADAVPAFVLPSEVLCEKISIIS